MSDIVKNLQDKKDKLLSLQTKRAKQEGSREQLLQLLKDKFDVNSLVEGKKRFEALLASITDNENKIEELDNDMEKIITMSTNT